jgi:hypothetical protein
MSFSNDSEGYLLDWFFSTDTPTAPAALYVALSTADPGEDGSTIAEPSGGSYARVSIGVGTDNWTRTAGSVANDNAITFPEATGDWGTLTHFALFSALTDGTFLGSGELGSSQAIDSGQTASFPASSLTITLT